MRGSNGSVLLGGAWIWKVCTLVSVSFMSSATLFSLSSLHFSWRPYIFSFQERLLMAPPHLAAYVYRLCLEYARLWSDDRDAMSFSL